MTVSRSTDDGKTWIHSTLSNDEGSVRALAVHPKTKVLFAGGQTYKNSVPSSRLFKSDDASATWKEMEDLRGKAACVNGVAFCATNPECVLVAMTNGVYFSKDAGSSWSAPTQNIAATCIIADASTKGRFYLGSKEGVWVSNDGGKSWTKMDDELPGRSITCLEFDAKNSVLYAGTERDGVVRLKVGNVKKTK